MSSSADIATDGLTSISGFQLAAFDDWVAVCLVLHTHKLSLLSVLEHPQHLLAGGQMTGSSSAEIATGGHTPISSFRVAVTD